MIQNGLNVIVKIIARLSALAAETERIHALLTTLEAEAEKEAAAVVQVPAGTLLKTEVCLCLGASWFSVWQAGGFLFFSICRKLS